MLARLSEDIGREDLNLLSIETYTAYSQANRRDLRLLHCLQPPAPPDRSARHTHACGFSIRRLAGSQLHHTADGGVRSLGVQPRLLLEQHMTIRLFRQNLIVICSQPLLALAHPQRSRTQRVRRCSTSR